VLIDDSYNASPESMEAAFSAQRAIASGRRTVAALGGMNELGAHADAAHFATGEAAAREGLSLVFATGPHADRFVEGFRTADDAGAEAYRAADVDELLDVLLRSLRDGDVVLVKGSRSFGMERVARAVSARFDDGKEEPA
jgi:UDP-N-acetylmuramoyl-tripeptide--D-alanyl-D-alanine ligase